MNTSIGRNDDSLGQFDSSSDKQYVTPVLKHTAPVQTKCTFCSATSDQKYHLFC